MSVTQTIPGALQTVYEPLHQAELQAVLREIQRTTPDEVPQPILVLGDRGMGKTTVLARVAAAVERRDEFSEWLALLLTGAQFNVASLGDLWVSLLDVLAATVARFDSDRSTRISAQVSEIERARDIDLEERGRRLLFDCATALDGRFLCLVDDFDLILESIDDKNAEHRLRQLLQNAPWLMWVATMRRPGVATVAYDRAFYEFFDVVQLSPPDTVTCVAAVDALTENRIQTDYLAGVCELLDPILGGSAETIALLGSIRFSHERPLWDQLVLFLESQRGCYRNVLDGLSDQSRRIVASLADAWHPVRIDDIADKLHLDRNVVGTQLRRLVDRGIVRKLPSSGRAVWYCLQDRAFNAWWLIHRRNVQARTFYHFIEFVDLFLLADLEEDRAPMENLTDLDPILSSGSREDKADALRGLLDHVRGMDCEDVRILLADKASRTGVLWPLRDALERTDNDRPRAPVVQTVLHGINAQFVKD